MTERARTIRASGSSCEPLRTGTAARRKASPMRAVDLRFFIAASFDRMVRLFTPTL
jgi:hypothetical protein